MKDPLGVSPSKGNQGTTRGKERILSTSLGIEPTTYGLHQPLLTLPTEKNGDDLGGESRRRKSMGTYIHIYSLLNLIDN